MDIVRDMIDWTTVLSTFIGAVAGALVAGWVSVSIAKRDRPRPIWQLSGPELFFPGEDSSSVGLIYRITNVGNGEAYAVTATPPRGSARDVPNSKPLVRPGKSLDVSFRLPVEGWAELHPMGGSDPKYGVWKEGTAVQMTWEEAPGFRKTRTHQFSLDIPKVDGMRFELVK